MMDDVSTAPRPRLSEQVADALQAEILSAPLVPGRRLPSEPELAERFDVSRTVVREAAKLLMQRGLVTVSPGRGMTVARFDGGLIAEQYALLLQLSDGTFDQLLELRLVLEVEMSGLAAARRSEDDVAAMRSANSRLVAAGDSRLDFLEADLAFHGLVAAATRNPFFGLLLKPINGFLHEAYSHGAGYPSEARGTLHEHAEIADAIAASDPGRARYAMEQHLRRILRHRRLLLSEDRSSDDPLPGSVRT
jgi:DNA-binding FadR family transcriptional regulator